MGDVVGMGVGTPFSYVGDNVGVLEGASVGDVEGKGVGAPA